MATEVVVVTPLKDPVVATRLPPIPVKLVDGMLLVNASETKYVTGLLTGASAYNVVPNVAEVVR